MMRPRSIRLPIKVLERVDAIYANLPKIECRGLCSNSCTAVPMSSFEWLRILARSGKVPTVRVRDAAGVGFCPLLTDDRRCGVYDVRPLICRLWGVVDDPQMRCPHGCVPDRYLSNEDACDLIDAVDKVGGGMCTKQAQIIYPDLAKAAGLRE
jgi:Fe-S-cluster containining protein